MTHLKLNQKLGPEFDDICPECKHEGLVWSTFESVTDEAFQAAYCPECDLRFEDVYMASYRLITREATRMANGQRRNG